MAKGSPNGPDKLLNFVAKVYDPVAKDYRPIYIAPDATNVVQGDVLLSDATASTDDAATGITAASPLAVKKVNDNANTKLSKTSTGAQTVTSPVTFTGKVTGNGGFQGNLTGNVTGNATSADKLKTAREIKITNGSKSAAVTFDGQSNVNLNLTSLDATTLSGLVPMSSIPQGALEHLVKVANQAARFALTTAQVQQGDSVLQLDTGVMYVVVDETKLNSADGYQEYKAATALEAQHADEADHATTATTATKLGSATVGSGIKLMYLNAGTATASSSAVGANAKPVYMTGGNITASTATVGAANKPVYMNAGTITAGTYELNKTVPANALFTDTKYSVFTGATASAAGSTGLVPAPAAGNNGKFLRGDGTWQVAGAVTGVKGNVESAYRTGQVNITLANIGAAGLVTANGYAGLTLSDGTTANYIRTTTNGFIPAASDSTNGSGMLGTTSWPFKEVNAKTFKGAFVGNLTGNASTATKATTATSATSATSATTATTASKVNNTITLSGNVTSGAVSLNTTNAITISTTIANGVVTLPKLGSDVGTVAVQSAAPTDAHVKLWVKI